MAYTRTRTAAPSGDGEGRLLPEDFAPFSESELRHLAASVAAAADTDAKMEILKDSKAGAALLRRAGDIEAVLAPLMGAFGDTPRFADAA